MLTIATRAGTHLDLEYVPRDVLSDRVLQDEDDVGGSARRTSWTGIPTHERQSISEHVVVVGITLFEWYAEAMTTAVPGVLAVSSGRVVAADPMFRMGMTFTIEVIGLVLDTGMLGTASHVLHAKVGFAKCGYHADDGSLRRGMFCHEVYRKEFVHTDVQFAVRVGERPSHALALFGLVVEADAETDVSGPVCDVLVDAHRAGRAHGRVLDGHRCWFLFQRVVLHCSQLRRFLHEFIEIQ